MGNGEQVQNISQICVRHFAEEIVQKELLGNAGQVRTRKQEYKISGIGVTMGTSVPIVACEQAPRWSQVKIKSMSKAS